MAVPDDPAVPDDLAARGAREARDTPSATAVHHIPH
jgi:hypothetical protein